MSARRSRFVLLSLLIAVGLAACRPKAEPPPNIVMVVMDTLRRDHLPAYGYHRPTTPAIDAFAAEAAVFDRAFAQSPSTKPSIASLFTSLLPSQHQVIANDQGLAPELLTFAEVLHADGFATAGFVENPMIAADFHFDQGFELWRLDHRRHGGADVTMDELDAEIHRWVMQPRESPFFLYVHYIDPHSPYWAPPAFRGRWSAEKPELRSIREGESTEEVDVAPLVDLYDEEISWVDGRFGHLLEHLDTLGLLEDTVVILLSDHGEGFGDHGYLHHSRSVYAELIDVPLMIRYPSRLPPGRHDVPVQHVDLYPTVLDLAEIDSSGLSLEGENVLDLLADPETARRRAIVSEQLRWYGPQRAFIQGDWKLVEHVKSGRLELFSLSADPGERDGSIGEGEEETAALLKSRLEARLRELESAAPPTASEIDPELQQALEALGYL